MTVKKSYNRRPPVSLQAREGGLRIRCCRLRRVGDLRAVDVRESGHRVRFRRGRGHDVEHLHAPHQQGVADQRSVAAPRHRLGAHDGGGLLARDVQQVVDPRDEFRCLHIVRVPAERGVAPSAVNGLLGRTAQAAQLLEPHIPDAVGGHTDRQRVLHVLRVVPRFGDRAHVGQGCDAVRGEHLDQFGQRMRGVPDGEHCRRHAASQPPVSVRRRLRRVWASPGLGGGAAFRRLGVSS
jgi:hypothetical protein